MTWSLPQPNSRLALPLTVSAGLSFFPWGKYALYPFKLFTTWVHECCHALSALLLGGRVRKIVLSPDTSGVTHYQLPRGRLRQGLVASSGYLGSSAAGCLLYFLSQRLTGSDARELALVMGALMLLSLAFWIRNVFGVLAVLCIAALMIAGGRLLSPAYSGLALSFLAIQTSLNAVLDIRTLFGLERGARSDARAMQTLFFLPAWFWALLWLGLSLALTYWTVAQSMGLPRL